MGRESQQLGARVLAPGASDPPCPSLPLALERTKATMVKSRAAKVRDLFNLLKFESEGVVFLLQTKRETMTQIGRKMKEITPEWRSSQIRGNLRGLTNTKTGKFETFGYAGPGAKGRVDLAPFIVGENKYLCSVPPTGEALRAICKEFEEKREDDAIHLVGGFVHKRVLREVKAPFAAQVLEAEDPTSPSSSSSSEGSDFIALTPQQVLDFSKQQARGQTALSLFGLPYYMSILRPLHYTALDLKNAAPEKEAEASES